MSTAREAALAINRDTCRTLADATAIIQSAIDAETAALRKERDALAAECVRLRRLTNAELCVQCGKVQPTHTRYEGDREQYLCCGCGKVLDENFDDSEYDDDGEDQP